MFNIETRIMKLAILLPVCFCMLASCTTEPPNFRNVQWGMGIEMVKDRETGKYLDGQHKPDHQNLYTQIYETEISDVTYELRYGFDNGKLVYAEYYKNFDDNNIDCGNIILSMVKSVNQKYGLPKHRVSKNTNMDISSMTCGELAEAKYTRSNYWDGKNKVSLHIFSTSGKSTHFSLSFTPGTTVKQEIIKNI